MEITELETQIKVVAEARNEAREKLEAKKLSLAEWEAQNKPLLEEVAIITEVVSEAEAKLRVLTLLAYAATGDKAPAKGVGIRERIVLTYDANIAFEFAKAHKIALNLDVPTFEKIAKADRPNFVKITTEPQATIAQDLKVE